MIVLMRRAAGRPAVDRSGNGLESFGSAWPARLLSGRRDLYLAEISI
jgi:hypothetical protein